MKKRSPPAKKSDTTSLEGAEAPLEPAGEVVVAHYTLPPDGPPTNRFIPGERCRSFQTRGGRGEIELW